MVAVLALEVLFGGVVLEAVAVSTLYVLNFRT